MGGKWPGLIGLEVARIEEEVAKFKEEMAKFGKEVAKIDWDAGSKIEMKIPGLGLKFQD